MKRNVLLGAVALAFFFFVFFGCTSNGESEDALIVPYFYDEEFSPFTGEIERYVAPEPDEEGYATQYYAVYGLGCPSGESPENVQFIWDNPSTGAVYIAGSLSGPVAHYNAQENAVFNISARVDYNCGGRAHVAELASERKKILEYIAEEGVLQVRELRATCPGGYFPATIVGSTPIEKGIPLGIDSGEGWVVSAYHLEVAEPYDYSTEGCAKYSEHWIHTYVRESANGTSCTLGECRGTWYTYECPEDNAEGLRKEVYSGKECASISEQKDFRQPQSWYVQIAKPEFPNS